MIYLIFFIIFVLVLRYFVSEKIHLNIPSFFKKGFKKMDDKYGVYCFCGKQGSGKTFSLVDSLEPLRKNKLVICNIKSLCLSHNYVTSFEQIKASTEFIYCSDFYKIIDFLEKQDPYQAQKYIIVFDEIFTLLEKGKLDKRCLAFLSQMRKRGLYLYTTAQEWLEINVTFRRYVRYQIECQMLSFPLLNFAFLFNKVNDAYQMKWDNLLNEYVSPRIQTNIKKCSLATANSYDTFETIETSPSKSPRSIARPAH